MTLATHEAYLETQVLTATPQRLRLMLIEAALRSARAAHAAWRENRLEPGDQAVAHCREILCELIGGIRPGESPTADRVLGIYLFLFTSLTTAQLARDFHRLGGIICVLEEEQETWREICQQLPELQVAQTSTTAREELAPSRVGGDFAISSPHFSPAPQASSSSQFSIDA
jgi:flagellar secretion chaperone FliS